MNKVLQVMIYYFNLFHIFSRLPPKDKHKSKGKLHSLYLIKYSYLLSCSPNYLYLSGSDCNKFFVAFVVQTSAHKTTTICQNLWKALGLSLCQPMFLLHTRNLLAQDRL